MMIENSNSPTKREMYNDILSIRISNKEEIERIKRELFYNYSTKNRILLDEKIKYDQQLKSELIALDEEILESSGFKIKKNEKYNRSNR